MMEATAVKRNSNFNDGCEANVRSSEVSSELSRFSDAIVGQSQLISMLENRLSSVVSDRKNSSDRTASPAEVLVPLADSIRGLRNHAEENNARINYLLENLEL